MSPTGVATCLQVVAVHPAPLSCVRRLPSLARSPPCVIQRGTTTAHETRLMASYNGQTPGRRWRWYLVAWLELPGLVAAPEEAVLGRPQVSRGRTCRFHGFSPNIPQSSDDDPRQKVFWRTCQVVSVQVHAGRASSIRLTRSGSIHRLRETGDSLPAKGNACWRPSSFSTHPGSHPCRLQITGLRSAGPTPPPGVPIRSRGSSSTTPGQASSCTASRSGARSAARVREFASFAACSSTLG